jgi:hypothetical protein
MACVWQARLSRYRGQQSRTLPTPGRQVEEFCQAGGGGGSRTPVRKAFPLEAYMLSSFA